MRADVLVGSAALHGAALALFIHWLPAKEAPPAPVVAPPIEVTVVPPPEPVMEVALVEPGTEAPPVVSPRTDAPERAPSRSAPHPATATRQGPPAADQLAATSTRATGAVPSDHAPSAGSEPARHEPSGGGPSSGGGLLHMRGPDLALAPGAAQRIAAGGEPLHGAARDSGKLENVPGGGAAIHDRVTTVTIERDGTAHFHDKPDVAVHFHSPIPHLDFKQDMHALGDMLDDWYRDPYAGTRYGPSTDLSEANHVAANLCDTWGDPGCDDPLATDAEKRTRSRQDMRVGVHGPADLTAYLYRKLAHSDPYASRKLRLLDDTRAERVERGEAFRAEQAARSAELMQRTLRQLWASTRDPVARKAALFELWDDCADDEAGARARAMVIGWIRANLPAGSPDAYTADELATCAAHTTSTQAFAPYADSPRTSRVTPNAIAPPGTR